MKKPEPLLAVALLLVALGTAVGLTTGEGRPSRARREATFVPLRTEKAFVAATQSERAVLYLRNKSSVESIISQRCVEAWARKHRPPFPVFIAEPGDQPYVHKWMVEKGMEERYGYYARHGMVVWLRRGTVAAALPNPGREEQASSLDPLTEQAFRRDER